MYILEMKNHYFNRGIKGDIKKSNFSKLLFENTINLSLSDPRSFFRNVLPGFSSFDSKIIVAGEGTDYTNLPIESSPPIEVLLKEREISEQNLKKLEEEINQTENMVKPPPLKNDTGNRNVMFIYHSHSRESFLPYLKGTGNEKTYHHSKINITMVGKRLGEALRNRGIGGIMSRK
ncbi:stage II sporulation protein P [Saccharococcus caldoxylosilyticus]|uniref:stage II sporulation protein P n=1 Tax=Saccharococcus caldoxylosilyticus TaxID=81408 RepID=UPI003D3514EA